MAEYDDSLYSSQAFESQTLTTGITESQVTDDQYDFCHPEDALKETSLCGILKRIDRGVILFMLDGFLTNGLVYSSIAISSNMLVVRFNFTKTCAGTYAMYPYLMFALSIPLVVGYVSCKGNRMIMIYVIGMLNILAFSIWAFMPPCDQCYLSLVPLFLLGLSLAIYILIQ